MYLKLLDVDRFIEKNKCLPVTTSSIYSPNRKSFHEGSLWSETIFGRVGSFERQVRFGYIDLNTKIINPVLYKIIQSSSEIVRNILVGKKLYVLKDGKLIEDELNGETSLVFLTSIIGKFKFVDVCKSDKTEEATYLDSLAPNMIVYDKLLVLPAGAMRDMSLKRSKQFTTEINEFYENLLFLVQQVKMSSDPLTQSAIAGSIQKICSKIQTYLQNQIKGKRGLYRSTILKKTVDFSARVIAVPNPNIPMGSVGLPWHMVMVLFEPFFINYVFHKDYVLKQQIAQFLNQSEELSIDDLQKMVKQISKSPTFIDDTLKSALVIAATEVAKEKLVLVKRDPVVSRSSYCSSSIVVLSEGRTVSVNPMMCNQMTLDFDGDSVAIFAVFTNQAREQAKKLNPTMSKTAWATPLTINNHHYPLTMDIISTAFLATRT